MLRKSLDLELVAQTLLEQLADFQQSLIVLDHVEILALVVLADAQDDQLGVLVQSSSFSAYSTTAR